MFDATLFSSIITLLLGVIFGGLATFYSMQDKLKQLQRVNLSRRIGMLEQVAQHVGKVSHVFSKYASLISEIGLRAERMSVKQERELQALSQDLVSIYEEIAIAESKLLLLGEKRLDKALKIYTSNMAQFRKQFYPGRFNNLEEMNQARRDIAQLRDQFYDILSERYDQNKLPLPTSAGTGFNLNRNFKIPFINSAKV